MSNRAAAAFFAWILLLVAVTAVVVGQQVRPHEPLVGRSEHKDGPADQKTKSESLQERTAQELLDRYLVGAAEYLGPGVLEKMTASSGTSARQRVSFLVLAGESGSSKQVKQLYGKVAPELENEEDPEWAELASVIDRLYEDYEGRRFEHPWLGDALREKLVQRLGWSGKLALAPEGGPSPAEREELLASAQRAFIVCTSVFLAVVFFFMIGLFGWFFLPVLIAFGKSRFGLPADVPHHGVYVETFTLWVILYGSLSLALILVAPPEIRLLMSALSMLLSLVALAWPVIRGVPWRQVREDIGWTWGRRPFLEPLVGIVTYSMTLYFVVIGALLVMLIIHLQRGMSAGGSVGSPDDFRPNPIVEYMTQMNFWTWVQVFFAASVVAPIVEETMFRGVLYRHLRATGRRLGTPLSVVLSALVVSFLFAIIHPQTLFAVPILMALAFGFALAREWRGSLIGPILAHGVHNGLIILVVSQLFAN
jgi:membrane protease YdiL (CAAX protease family)